MLDEYLPLWKPIAVRQENLALMSNACGKVLIAQYDFWREVHLKYLHTQNIMTLAVVVIFDLLTWASCVLTFKTEVREREEMDL